MRTIGESFQGRHNSLNFLRLCLALVVIFDHGIVLGGYASGYINNRTTLGLMAVFGFFGISGYLIAGSAERNHVGRYLWQRVLRIFPGFWVCLIVTAFLFALTGWVHYNPAVARHCGISCYVDQPDGPLGFIFHNSWLRMNQVTITNSLHIGREPPIWNGSLWTLFYEFLCYLLLAALAVLGLLRHRILVAVLAVCVWIAESVITLVPRFDQQFNLVRHWDITVMLAFVPVFLTGSLLYLYRDKTPDSGWLALASTGLFLAGLVLPLGGGVPPNWLSSVDLTAPFIVYPLLWLGIHLPLQKVGARNDYSYGFYIYAWPVQQLLVVWGVARWGYWPYTLLAVAATFPFAVASWWAIEKHALKLKALHLNAPKPSSITPASSSATEVIR